MEPLALWFDNNRDGISQTGEVKRLDEVGVESLFYHPDKMDKGDVYASTGYERRIGERNVIAASVDWFGEGDNSKFELISRHLNNSTFCSEVGKSAELGHLDEILDSMRTHRQSLESVGKDVSRSNINGWWRWTVDEKEGQYAPAGYLSFKDLNSKDNAITGHSISETHFTRKAGDATRMVTVYTLKGRKEASTDGGVKVTFEIRTKEGALIQSAAELSPDGTTLKGRSIATVMLDAKRRILEYSWIATQQ